MASSIIGWIRALPIYAQAMRVRGDSTRMVRLASEGQRSRRWPDDASHPSRLTMTLENGLGAVLLANRDKLLRFLRAHGAGDAADDLLQELWIRVTGGT